MILGLYHPISMEMFAKNHLSYTRNKGLGFIAKFNNIYVITEVKFLTDFGGYQNAQYEDVISTMRGNLNNSGKDVRQIAILDGVILIHKLVSDKGTLYFHIDDKVGYYEKVYR